jgi:hypothetical protein
MESVSFFFFFFSFLFIFHFFFALRNLAFVSSHLLSFSVVIFIGAGLLLETASVPSADRFGDSSLRGNECSYNFSWFSPFNLFIPILSGQISVSGFGCADGEVDQFKNADVPLVETDLSSSPRTFHFFQNEIQHKKFIQNLPPSRKFAVSSCFFFLALFWSIIFVFVRL